jgi:nitroreductase
MSTAIISPEQLVNQLNWRYATKKFDTSRKIPDEVWSALEQSLVLAPSSFGLQPWKFIVVRNPEVRQKLVEHTWGQVQVAEASHLVVLAIKKNVGDVDVDRHITRMTEVQQTPPEALQGLAKMIKGFLVNPPYPLEMDCWSARQVYIALGQYMTSAAMLGIDTCPIEGFVPAKYDEVLGLTEQGYSAVVVCPAGYRDPEDKYAARPKVRFPLEEIVQHID